MTIQASGSHLGWIQGWVRGARKYRGMGTVCRIEQVVSGITKLVEPSAGGRVGDGLRGTAPSITTDM